ncbi:hypothetical protein KJ359_009678 [Pestalotiopsis sp. 9143b]|nr:hypothetical protein KJ359_009678 [Pestalotiopsis sp. 9143b]
MSINFALPAVDQDTPLFRLPTELRRRIYQYMLTPSHVHIERKVDYKLTKSGIEVINPGPVTRSKSQRRRAEDESVDMMDLWWSGQPSNHWTCKRIILDQKTRFKINDSASRQDARNALFDVYYCQSQRPGGPSAVPPGYLDHESCRGDREQTPFFGSNLDGLLMTCQWAYMDARSVGNSVDRSAKVFTPNLSRNDARLELGTHNLHFSDLQDLTCFTELVSLELSESLSNLSVHVDSMESPYWKTFCQTYLQPWSRISLMPWEPNEKTAPISFYHNHTTHDLANPHEPDHQAEVAEALASTWVVPNIQVHSARGAWSTKFRMSALKARSGGPINLRLSFPMFLRRDEPQYSQCLDNPERRPTGCRDLPVPHSEMDHTTIMPFNQRRWLSERHDKRPIAKAEMDWNGDMAYEHLGLEEPRRLYPGHPEKLCEMEYTSLYDSGMDYLVRLKMWFDRNPEEKGSAEWRQRQGDFDQQFRSMFLRSRNTVPRNDVLLHGVHWRIDFLDNCQGLEDLEMDFYGDGQSPGTVQEFRSHATELFRDGLKERFTGRGRTSSDGSQTVESTFWNIGPHPEPFFAGWADPDGNMRGLNMDEEWQH